MSELVTVIAEWGAGFLELMGVAVIVLFAIISTIKALIDWIRKDGVKAVYDEYRHFFARGILLGLELLVAADIIHTVAVNLTFTSVGVLAIVVIIRTFLSFTLQVETTGRWPWQEKFNKPPK